MWRIRSARVVRTQSCPEGTNLLRWVGLAERGVGQSSVYQHLLHELYGTVGALPTAAHESLWRKLPINQETRPTVNAPRMAHQKDCTPKPGTNHAANPNASPLTTK